MLWEVSLLEEESQDQKFEKILIGFTIESLQLGDQVFFALSLSLSLFLSLSLSLFFLLLFINHFFREGSLLEGNTKNKNKNPHNLSIIMMTLSNYL